MEKGPSFIYCTGQICSVKEGVCNDDQKNSRKNQEKPTVKTKAECCSAKLKPLPQWHFHAHKTRFICNEEWDGTTVAMASDGSTHTAHSLGTCVSCLPFVLHSTLPTISTSRMPLHFSLPPLQQQILFPLALCAISFSHSPSKSQCDTAEALSPFRKDRVHYSCLLLSTKFTSSGDMTRVNGFKL